MVKINAKQTLRISELVIMIAARMRELEECLTQDIAFLSKPIEF